ncbi:MAG: hypothetical protein WDZ84_14360 [Rhodovibrionaceae bacterium]
MPPKIKIPLSLLVVVAACAVSYFQHRAGQPVTPWIALGLGAFMIFAMWIFPEEKKKKPKP